MVTISNALKDLKAIMPVKSFSRLKLYLTVTGFIKQDKNILDFFRLPVTNKTLFLDFSKTNWNAPSTRENAISAVNVALNKDIIKNGFSIDEFKAISIAIQECTDFVRGAKGPLATEAAGAPEAPVAPAGATEAAGAPADDAPYYLSHETGNDAINYIHKQLASQSKTISSLYTTVLLKKKEDSKLVSTMQFCIDFLLALYKETSQCKENCIAVENLIKQQIEKAKLV